jgi:hypothetical protein
MYTYGLPSGESTRGSGWTDSASSHDAVRSYAARILETDMYARRAAYDLKKLRAKNLLTKRHSRRYSISSEAIRQDMFTLFDDLRIAAQKRQSFVDVVSGSAYPPMVGERSVRPGSMHFRTRINSVT